MAYILKNTSGLINTRVTDAGRQKISQGNFNISYFQIGDSEVSYNILPPTYNQKNSFVLEPPFNSQNISGIPNSNKQSIKYPYYVDGNEGNTYGIPFMDSGVDSVFNRAPLRGFFSGDTKISDIKWSALTSNYYVVSANYVVDMSTLNGTDKITIISNGCDNTNTNKPSVGDIITIFYDGEANKNCNCVNTPQQTPTPTPTPTPTKQFFQNEVSGDYLVYNQSNYYVSSNPYGDSEPMSTPTPTPTKNTNPCITPTRTPTPTRTSCTPKQINICQPTPEPFCLMNMYSCYSILTYKIVDVCENLIKLDRPTPNFTMLSNNECIARTLIYPSNMQSLYDSTTPMKHWNEDVVDFESICGTDEFDVKIWNMNIPWTESPAGLNSVLYEDYTKFGSVDYIGTKEYFGYTSQKGQRDTSEVFYYNSFDEKITVTPEEQKAVAIIHYTNQTIDFFYGEKFALEPFNPSNPDDTTGQARNFKLHIPWIMWHKNPECCFGETFWVDPPGFDDKNLFEVHYLESTKNDNMNQPGIRYYHLWDTNPNANGLPNRIGKVFPDSKVIIIDDEEIIAAMSYKSNRNWTLTAPQLSLITPNTCGVPGITNNGVLTGNSETMYITYRLSNTSTFTNSLHCNYYSKIIGNNNECNPNVSQNVAVRFGSEFSCLVQGYTPPPIPTPTPTQTPTPTPTKTVGHNTTPTPTPTKTSIPIINSCYILTQDLNIINTNSGDDLIWCNQQILNIPFLVQNSNFISFDNLTNLLTTNETNCESFCETPRGFLADKFEILVQKVPTGQRPNPSLWKIIDYTYLIESEMVNGYLTQDSLTGTTFVVTKEQYESASYYDLNNYINLVPNGTSTTNLNFGDEYYFYGSLETDIQATIYEMKYKVNLNATEFQNTSNPTWTQGTESYITEITLLDSNKDIMVMSKLQSPVLRQGIQQFVVKIDF
jgi:hypothetical protein